MKTRGCFMSVYSRLSYKLGQKYWKMDFFFLCLFEILKVLPNSPQRVSSCSKNFAYVIFIYCHFPQLYFDFEVLFTEKNTTSQVSVDGFKVSVVRLIGSLVTVVTVKCVTNGRDQQKVSVL